MTWAEELDPVSLEFAEEQYERWLRDPGQVPPSWRAAFEGLEPAPGARPAARGPSFRVASLFNPPPAATDGRHAVEVAALQDRVDQFIRAYRVRGHLEAQLDPLGIPRPRQPELDPAFYGLGEADMDRTFSTHTILGAETLTLRRIHERLRNTYCRSIGVQFMHINDLALKTWLQERMEGTENRLDLSRDDQLRILTRLTDAVIFEDFIQKKYLGAKSFSLEGSESLIPLMELAIEKAGDQGLEEIVIGMPHRGRLNVLANILGKSPRRIFQEFEDAHAEAFLGHGDVKYHLGHSTEWTTARNKKVHISLCFNPSHLEIVNPVGMGRTRAKQDRVNDTWRARGMLLLIHGDAAFAGEGIVQETLNMSALRGYTVGGTLHVVVNNQIGFTTDPSDSRSSIYATDIARMLEVPIFHVNGEDPEAVAQVVRLAMDFRRAYQRDVVIDMYAYRRRGHNEGDEPAFTQPLMYKAIERRKNVREGYLEHLLKLGGVTRQQADEITVRRREQFEAELSAARKAPPPSPAEPRGLWSGFRGGPDAAVPEVDTGVARDRLASLLDGLTRVPAGFQPHPKIVRWLEQRAAMARGEKPLDWSAGEALALATLAAAGHRVRLTGQDTERGTFTQRHAVLHDFQDGRTWTALQQVTRGQAPVEIRNSPLNETGVLGFEYGYSLDAPGALVAWEAQFGDFVNVAQPIIDQFLASAESKWRRLSGLVLLLPHGMEGQGPEHSSARMERFLQLCAEDNLQVVQPSTPAQYFHVLRRQVLRPWRKPLVVMTPKSLLRHPRCVSPLEDLAAGTFRRILPDDRPEPAKTSRVLLCSGKVFYDLAKHRADHGRDDVAILRVEQLYPLSDDAIREALAPYAPGTPVAWVQEETGNQGAWEHLRARFGDTILGRWPLRGVSRPSSASPATGSHSSHDLEQERLVAEAFAS